MDCSAYQDITVLIELIDTMATIDGFIAGVFGAAFFHLCSYFFRESKPRRDKELRSDDEAPSRPLK